MFASALLSSVLSLAVVTAPAAAVEPEPTTPVEPVSGGGTTTAVDALAVVQDLLDGVTGPPTHDDAVPELTLALRDLALLKHRLPPVLRPVADRYLARPTDGAGDQFKDGYSVKEAPPVCSEVVCVHYVTRSDDRVPAADKDGNGVPDYVDFALTTMTHVHQTYVAAGYRAPRGDGTRGGNAKPDIYLANVGGRGLYGYCSTDEDFPVRGPQNAWGYCVLDNDYSRNEFPTSTPQDNFRVTAAHEYFHTVQFGYDISEDPWIMEATATWAEDEVYDRINDNLQYLKFGPMRHPGTPMDLFDREYPGLYHYGTWSFFRFLTERFTAAKGGMPVLVRDLWKRLDDAPGGPDDYSLQGLTRVLRKHKISLRDAFAAYSAANRMPARSYAEGKSYPTAPLAARATLAPGRLVAKPRRFTLDHLTSATVRYTPGKQLGGAAWKLRVKLDLAPRYRGSAAVLTVVPRRGAPESTLVPLDKNGDAKRTVGFSRGAVKSVEVTLANASDKFACNKRTTYSCAGRAKWDRQAARVSAKAFR